VWQNIILKKSSEFKTVLAWYQRWTRPTSEKQQSFNDIWVTKEELLDRPRGNYAIDNVERSISTLDTNLYDLYEKDQEVPPELIEITELDESVIDTKGKFYLYDNLRDRDKRMLDRMAQNAWDGTISRIKRSKYGFSMQTPATKRRQLKRIIPDELLREFSEEDIKGLEKLVASNYRYKRSLKYIIEDFNDEMFDAKTAAKQIREILNVFRTRWEDMYNERF
tara:strand:- start:18 stop:683 length:666 start_codon:yes stop_codon:yes gene_type:complete